VALYRRVFSVPDVAVRHQEFLAAIKTAEAVEAAWARAGKPGVAAGTVRTLRAAYLDFNRGLDQLATDTAAEARRTIVSILKAKQKRPTTGMGAHLSTAIVCRPIHDFGSLGTGEVGIADIQLLDRVVNPFGPQYGPYWRAIEQGSTRAVGRTLIGGFFSTGLAAGPFAPDPNQFRRHPIFVTGAQGRAAYGGAGHSGGFGAQGGGGKLMKIRRRIEPQHFIRDGADLVEVRWRAGLAAVEQRAMREIAAVTRPLP
jgi:hypothetical protein